MLVKILVYLAMFFTFVGVLIVMMIRDWRK